MSGLLTEAEAFAISINAKVTLPSVRCTDPKFVYVSHDHTNLKERFEQMTTHFNDDEAYRIRRDAEIARTAPAWFKEAA